MPRFRQTSEVLKLMSKKENIRDIGIIAHIDHGKCIDGESRVLLDTGESVKIKDLFEKFASRGEVRTVKGGYVVQTGDLKVLGADLKSFKLKPVKAHYIWKLKADRLIKIETETGESIITTPEHPFFTINRNGVVSPVRADELNPENWILRPSNIKKEGSSQSPARDKHSKFLPIPRPVLNAVRMVLGYFGYEDGKRDETLYGKNGLDAESLREILRRCTIISEKLLYDREASKLILKEIASEPQTILALKDKLKLPSRVISSYVSSFISNGLVRLTDGSAISLTELGESLLEAWLNESITLEYARRLLEHWCTLLEGDLSFIKVTRKVELRGDFWVYDLTTSTHTFIANGLLVHNTTMTDSLLAEAGLLSPKIAGEARALDYLEEEQKRGITIKTANISLLHEIEGTPYLINLIDTPGHVDFTGKVTRALRAIDGVVVVVDAVEEVMVQTETVTRQALNERVKPVLFINKVDRLIRELKLTPEEVQRRFIRIIRDFNNLIDLYGEPEFKKQWKVDPVKGTVAFGSALHRWGFTLEIAQKKGLKFKDIIEAYRENRWQELQKTIPLHEAILDMVVKNLPNPIEAQKYRIPKIWKGDLDSEIGQAMLNCDESGPTVACITMAQMDPHAGLVATGRLYSGRLTEGDHVYLVGAKKEYRVQQVSMYMGAFREVVNSIGSGNIAAALGLDLARAGETLVDISYKDGMVPFERITYVSEPVITIALEPKHPRDLPRLVDVMRRLSIEDPNLVTTINKETGEYLLSGMGELHLEIAIKFMKDYAPGLEIVTSKPIVVYRESVTDQGVVAMAKSPNKHNRFWIQVEPLEEEVIRMMEEGEISEYMGRQKMADILHRKAGWPTEEARNVWALEEHRNILINLTKGVQFLREVRDMVISGFRWAAQAAPLCEEPMRGVKVKLLDAQLHEDPVHRGPAQIMPAVRRAIFGSFLTAKPILLEPIYRIQVSVPVQWVGAVSSLITQKRGRILSSEQKGAVLKIDGYIPVAETFGLSAEMRSATSGHAFWQSQFDHWEKVPENLAAIVIAEIRERRGLPKEVPPASRFIDEA
ncbi:elongation factor EF-2 [Candidatus Bathyarchaeota archaeon]|nr:MAG: elongation factor EF-2 [Candidatus Bathyarchaeota archaeon]